VLKTLSFTRSELAVTVARKASVARPRGIAIGVPGGIALGHSLSGLFARDIYAVTRPSVPLSPSSSPTSWPPSAGRWPQQPLVLSRSGGVN